MINGVLNIYKESGYTSFDVVARLRGILRQKKIGHTGTLDPMAEGVLIVCLGNATKLVDMITSGDKCYEATLKLGITTDTEDITGQMLTESDVNVTEEAVRSAILSFVGEYDQIPPMYSAIKKDGRKLYEYARAGIEVKREARKVEIYSIEDIRIEALYASFKVHCSKGTYIRSLCRDIGGRLGTGATLTALKRSEVHGFEAKDALTVDEISKLAEAGELSKYVLPADSLLMEYPAYHIEDDYIKYLNNGNKLFNYQLVSDKIKGVRPEEEMIRVYDIKGLRALYIKTEEPNTYKPYKMFVDIRE